MDTNYYRLCERVAALIGAEKDNVIFTAPGAEANNVAVKGTALANRNKGKHVIVSAIENHSVLNSARFLERFLDFEVTFLPVDGYGLWMLNSIPSDASQRLQCSAW